MSKVSLGTGLKNYWSSLKNHPSIYFLVVGVTFGLVFLLITPPFETPDEPAHFMRAYQISEGNFVVDTNTEGVGGFLPTSINKTIQLTTTNPDIMFHPENQYSLSRTREALKIRLQPEKKMFYGFGPTAPYPPVSYIPQSLAILVGRLFSWPPVVLMYMGRLANLIAWLAMFALAVWLMPKRKWPLVFVGLVPMALFESVSLSADVMAIGSLAVFLALVLKYTVENTVLNVKKLALLLGVALILALSKQAMVIFVPLVFLIPASRIPAKIGSLRVHPRLTQLLIVVVPAAVFGLWLHIIRGINVVGSAVNGQNPALQTGFIHHHLLTYGGVIARTLLLTGSDLMSGSFIGNFGWLDTPLPEFIVVAGYILLFLVFVVDFGQPKLALTRPQKILMLILGAIYSLAAITALYLYFTPVASRTVWGLVGRYFLPVALLITPLSQGKWLRTSSKSYLKIATLAPLLLLLYSALTIAYRYYVHV